MPDIPVWNKCGNKCVMCANTAGFSRNTAGDYSLARVSLPPEDRAYPPACSACRAREICVGLMKPYLRRYGAGELRPLRGSKD